MYERCKAERWHYEDRAWRCAEVTIPSLFPRPGSNASTEFLAPFNSEGARGVNNLAAAMVLGLLPPNYPFFRLQLQPKAKVALQAIDAERAGVGQEPVVLTQVEHGLAMREQSILAAIEEQNFRTPGYTMSRQLIVGGNAMIEFLPEGGMRVHRLDSYTVERNPDDSPRTIVLREKIRKDSLPPELAEEVARQGQSGKVVSRDPAQWFSGADTGYFERNDDRHCDLYTRITFSGSKCVTDQEVAGILIPESSPIPARDCPFIPLRFTRVDGENYGRGYTEEFYGDLRSSEALTQAIVEATAASAKVVFLVRPGALTSAKSLADASNLSFRAGHKDDVTTLQVEKYADLRVAQEVLDRINGEISRSFAVPKIRDAERVTTEEIRFVQEQLEKIQGGSFALLAREFQLPLVSRVMNQLDREAGLPPLQEDMAKPAIITGVQALGRTHDAMKLDRFVAAAGQVLGPEIVARYMNPSEWLMRKAAAEGLDPKGLVFTAGELAERDQAQQQAAMQARAGEEAINRTGEIAVAAATQGAASQAA